MKLRIDRLAQLISEDPDNLNMVRLYHGTFDRTSFVELLDTGCFEPNTYFTTTIETAIGYGEGRTSGAGRKLGRDRSHDCNSYLLSVDVNRSRPAHMDEDNMVSMFWGSDISYMIPSLDTDEVERFNAYVRQLMVSRGEISTDETDMSESGPPSDDQGMALEISKNWPFPLEKLLTRWDRDGTEARVFFTDRICGISGAYILVPGKSPTSWPVCGEVVIDGGDMKIGDKFLSWKYGL
jgi:hypothetical protein